MSDPLKGLSEVRKFRNLPPLEKWNPPYCGELDIHIKRNGQWFYLGTPIGRPELVRLFSTILWREGADYFLMTPVEKVKIRVDDAPFLAVDFERIGNDLHFRTQTDDEMIAGPLNPIRIEYDQNHEPSPYILVRRNLWARIDRKSFYRLVEIGEIDGDFFGLRSMGVFFPIIEARFLKA